MYRILKFFLFKINPESAHHLTFRLLHFLFSIPLVPSIFKWSYQYKHTSLEKKLLGLTFKNPVGLAAGFDKDAKHIELLDALGFGFIEIGTLTPKPQPGNDKPRLFRLPQDEALINRMGFNNEGVDAAVERIKKIKNKQIIIGGNIGKNKVTANEDAIYDYIYCFEKLYDYVNYFVVNVSSPNTPGLRSLQEKEPLLKILSTLQAMNVQGKNPKPILLKIAPDLTEEQLNDIIEIVVESKIAGVIATNTTIAREPLTTDKNYVESIGAGGLSGKPVREKSTEVIQYISEKSSGKFALIGVGGIHSAADAQEKISAGADLVQLYTGFIYKGPSLISKINKSFVQ
jgi:dihydroorotate dehydrogenase